MPVTASRNASVPKAESWLRTLAAALPPVLEVPKSTYNARALLNVRLDTEQTVPSEDVPLLL